MAAEYYGTWILADGGVEDRHGTVIPVSAMNIEHFRKNPICTLHHDPSRPVGYWANDRIDGERWLAELMIDPSASADAREAAALIESGSLRAASIEFLGDCLRGVCKGVEVICASVVSVGSNREALRIRSNELGNTIMTTVQEDTTMTETDTTTTAEQPQVVSRSAAPAIHTKARRYDLTRVMAAAAQQRNLDGLEAEIDQEQRRVQRWRNFSDASITVPMRALGIGKRANSALSGGNLEATTGEQYLDQLFAKVGDGIENELLSERVGAQVITGLTEASALIPSMTDKLACTHVGLDSDLADSGDAPFVNGTLTPKKVGAISTMNLSSVLAMHPRVGTDFISNLLGSALSEEISRAFVSGDNSTTATEPNGLIKLSTDTTEVIVPATGAVASFDKVKRSYLNYAGVNAPQPTWIIRHELLDALKVVAAFSGSNESVATALGLPSGNLSGYPVMGTTAVAATATTPGFFGHLGTLVHALWSGVEIVINPYHADAFASGAVKVRITALHDINAIDVGLIRRFSADLS